MHKTKYSFIGVILLCIYLIYCNNKPKIIDSVYHQIVVKNKLENLYDSAKWIIYSSNYHFNGIEVIQIDSDEKRMYYPDINLSSCFLKMNNCIRGSDTTIFIFDFHYLDTMNICYSVKGANLNSVMFINNDTIIYRSADNNFGEDFISFIKKYEEGDTLLEWRKGGYYTLKEENILFPKYLRKNELKLNPWLKGEAIRRGILTE